MARGTLERVFKTCPSLSRAHVLDAETGSDLTMPEFAKAGKVQPVGAA